MWYCGRHRRSWWKVHANDLIMTAGLALIFGLPLFILFTA